MDLDPASTAKPTALKSIRPLKWRSPNGSQRARSTGGSKNVSNGSAGYAVRMAENGGSELLIFVPRAAHSLDFQVFTRWSPTPYSGC
jgi:hypothetical protein